MNFVEIALVYIALLVILPNHTFLYRWLMSIIVAIDCLANALILLGDYRETISGRVGKAYYIRGVKWLKIPYYFINGLFFPFQRNMMHCRDSIDRKVGDKTIWRWK